MERQELLLHFTCQCVACENNYPLFEDLTHGSIPELKLDEKVGESSKQIYVDYINKYASYYPCREVVRAEGLFRFHINSVYVEAASRRLNIDWEKLRPV